jgi:Protein of unknown function (DUF2510)
MSAPDLPDRTPGAPGWYVDPDAPERERWWSGTEWTDVIAPRARNPFGVEFERSMRPATNTLAGRTRFVAFGAVVMLFLAVADGSLLGDGAPSALAVVGLVGVGILGVVGALLGWVALRRAGVHGGAGAARASIVLSVAAIGLALFALLVP